MHWWCACTCMGMDMWIVFSILNSIFAWHCIRFHQHLLYICCWLLCFFRTHKFIVEHIFDWSMQAQHLLNEEKTHRFFLYIIWISDFLLSRKKTEKVKKSGITVVNNEWCLKFPKFALHKIEINCGVLKRMEWKIHQNHWTINVFFNVNIGSKQKKMPDFFTVLEIKVFRFQNVTSQPLHDSSLKIRKRKTSWIQCEDSHKIPKLEYSIYRVRSVRSLYKETMQGIY